MGKEIRCKTPEDCKKIKCKYWMCDNIIDIKGELVLIAPCVESIEEEE